MATADLPKDSKPPLTLRPNLKSEKGSVTAAAAAYTPAGGFLLVKIKPPLKGEAFLYLGSLLVFRLPFRGAGTAGD